MRNKLEMVRGGLDVKIENNTSNESLNSFPTPVFTKLVRVLLMGMLINWPLFMLLYCNNVSGAASNSIIRFTTPCDSSEFAVRPRRTNEVV